MSDEQGLMGELGLNLPDPDMSERTKPGSYYSQDARGAALGLIGGLIGSFTGDTKGMKGMKEGYTQQMEMHRNRVLSQQTGISVEDIEKRKSIRTQANQFKPHATDPDDAEEERILNIINLARGVGDDRIAAQAFTKLQNHRKGRAEMDKLEDENALRDKKRDMLGKETMQVQRNSDGKLINGLQDMNGDFVYNGGVLKGDEYTIPMDQTAQDRARSSQSVGHVLKLGGVTQTAQDSMRGAVTTYMESLPVYGRVLSNMLDDMEQSPDDGINYLADAGIVTGKVDRWARDLQSIVHSAAPGFDVFNYSDDQGVLKNVRDNLQDTGRLSWTNPDGKSKDLTGLISIPAQIGRDAAKAAEYQANIIMLAYLEARQREPSNRGLSDNDIKLALRALGTDSGNPQVIIRNFAQKMMAGPGIIRDRIQLQANTIKGHGRFTERDVFEMYGYGELENRTARWADRFGIEGIDESGVTRHTEIYDADARQQGGKVGAGTGIASELAAPRPTRVKKVGGATIIFDEETE